MKDSFHNIPDSICAFLRFLGASTKVNLTIAVLVFATVLGAATIHGTLVDPQNERVPNANVILYSRESGTTAPTRTDSNGSFRFDNLVPGTYLLRVTAEGFAGFTTEEIAVKAGDAIEQEIRLELADLRTEVMVTASSTPLLGEEVAKATDVLTGEEMALRDEHSLAEALSLIPGLRVRRRGGPGGTASVHVRGLRSNDTAVLIDGLRFRDPSEPQGSVAPLWQDLEVVSTERVEVLRGSGSSLYGSHAMGGVVNVVTDQGGGQPHGEVQAEGGGLGFMRGLTKFSGGAFADRLIYSGGAAHVNVVNGLDGVTPHRNTSGQGFARYSLRDGLNLSGRLLAYDTFLRLNDSPYVASEMEANLPADGLVQGIALSADERERIEQGLSYDVGSATYVPSLNDPDDRRATSMVNLATILSHQVNPDWSYRVSYQLQDLDRDFETGPAGQRYEPVGFSTSNAYDSRVHMLQFRSDLQLGQYNLISGGYEYEDTSFVNVNTDENPDAAARAYDRTRISERSHSVFAQDQISLLNRNLQIALSGRVQTFDLSTPEFVGGVSPYEGYEPESPKSGLTGDAAISYMFRSTGTKWRAHVGNSYRAPSLYERFGSSFYYGSFSAYGDPRLRPERALSVDTGFDQYLFGSSVKLGATYFYTKLQETIAFDFSGLIPYDDPFGRWGGYLNLPGGLARGVELSVNATPARGTVINASYTYANTLQVAPLDVAGAAMRTPGISKNSFSLLASQWIGRRLNVTFDLFAADDYLTLFSTTSGTRGFEMNGPFKADVVVRYVVPLTDTRNMEFFGKIENLTDHENYEDGIRNPGIWGVGGIRIMF